MIHGLKHLHVEVQGFEDMSPLTLHCHFYLTNGP